MMGMRTRRGLEEHQASNLRVGGPNPSECSKLTQGNGHNLN